MNEEISALLVYDQEEPLEALKSGLEQRAVRVSRIRTCAEASPALKATDPPHLIFTDTTLPDGTWADVLALAPDAPEPVNVIVVARLGAVKFYVDVIEHGAFDFIAPPFTGHDFDHVLRCAVDNVLRRRDAQSPVEEPGSRLMVSPALQPVSK